MIHTPATTPLQPTVTRWLTALACWLVLGLALGSPMGWVQAQTTTALLPVPAPALVTDQTGTLTAQQLAGLEVRLRAFEQRKGSQLVLLMVAKNDRSVRIEVGYGLEGVLSDAATKHLISEAILPRFRESDFYGGINEALASTPSQSQKRPPTSVQDLFNLAPVLLVAVMEVGEPSYRVWRLYMAACALEFEAGGTGIYQILA